MSYKKSILILYLLSSKWLGIVSSKAVDELKIKIKVIKTELHYCTINLNERERVGSVVG